MQRAPVRLALSSGGSAGLPCFAGFVYPDVLCRGRLLCVAPVSIVCVLRQISGRKSDASSLRASILIEIHGEKWGALGDRGDEDLLYYPLVKSKREILIVALYEKSIDFSQSQL
jgi:hypothetical protein